jgi:hypothetical protein
MSPKATEASGSNAWQSALLAAVAGLIVFSLMIDPSIVNPLNVDWLASGDPAQSYLGWMFFRHEPWSWPPGLALRLGMEQASSIVYSDSIPLLAIPFKLISGYLPASFQYYGLWLFSCYALQGFFACRLVMLFSTRRAVIVGGVLLFLLSPIMLLRAQAHFALSAHWIVVAALYLYYAPSTRRRWLHWLVLLWLAPLVHAYLMFMAYAIWAACLLQHVVFDRSRSLAFLLIWAALAVAGSLAVMWLAGYFLQMDVSSGGFGYYSMNVLSPLLPIGVGPFVVGAPAAATAGQYEGFNYLGLGVVVALAVTVVRRILIWLRPAQMSQATYPFRSEWPLLLCCLGLTLLAVSNVVTVASHILFTIPLSAQIKDALNVFRASGRLFWPVYYLLLLAAVRGAASLSVPLCKRFLFVVLVLQMVDLWPFIHEIHQNSEVGAQQNRFPKFDSPFWKLARAHYDRLYVIPGIYREDSNITYESLAGAYRFAIDSAYYARMPSLEHRMPRERRHAQFFTGDLDGRGLYLIQPESASHFDAMQSLLPKSTGVGHVDGFTVVAPGWFAALDKPRGYLDRPVPHDFPAIEAGRDYHFGASDPGMRFVLAGWSVPGDHAVWSVGASSVLAFRVPADSDDVHVAVHVMPYLPAASPRLIVNVRMNGYPVAHWIFERGKPDPDTVVLIPASSLKKQGGNIALQFAFDQPRSPLHSGESTDPREIALLLRGMQMK